RAALQPRLDATLAGEFPELRDLDRAALLDASRELLSEQPLTRSQLGRALATRFRSYQADALAFAATRALPLVHLPPAGEWGSRAAPRYAAAEAWLGRRPAPRELAEENLVRRYLAAFGPASVADISAWSGVPGLQGVVTRIQKDLVRIPGAGGRALWDVPGAPDDSGNPARVCLLPAYDNLLFAYADRSRVVPRAYQAPLSRGAAPILDDGFVAGTWHLTETEAGEVRCEVRGARDLAYDAVRAEAAAMAGRLFPGRALRLEVLPER
ncbi:MAG: winged helix DNA-binding domain-containing protein, partial [Candidatus Dormibacteraeota bacterium]|nr:winged helix DNA-binding domain-containing protein [Candidatus Dormibacteraeota bacterium]